MANPEHVQALHDLIRQRVVNIDLSGADLAGIRSSSIRLQWARLAGADLRSADLSGGYLSHCDLQNARLQKARLVLADFRLANLANSDLRGANLNGAVLTGANLADANLSRANLVKARLEGADLTGADLAHTDLRGAQGWTADQILSAKNSDKAILDAKMLAALGRDGDLNVSRHGRKPKDRSKRNQVDLLFAETRPTFGDLFLLCGEVHPQFPPTGDFGFEKLADLNVEQVDDYFAICRNGDPAVWIFPLVRGVVVEHHPGPFDGLRLELADSSQKKLWSNCLARFKSELKVLADD